MAKKMSESQLISVLAKAIADSEQINDGKLAKERELVAKYYRGELPEPMNKGDSKYVSRDVFDAVDSMRATTLEAFMASSRIVFFRPEKGETVAEAKQATEYCRHVFFKENDGENIMYEALTEGLMNRFVVAKVYHDETTEEDEFEFENLSAEELTLATDGIDAEFYDTTVDPDTGFISGSYSVNRKAGGIRIEIIQPEDILVASNTTCLRKAKYIIHRTSKTRSELLKQGYDKDKVEDLTFGENSSLTNYEKQLRNDPIGDVLTDFTAYDPASEETVLYELYIHLDREGSGKSALWKICYSQGVILAEEKVKEHPFVGFVPIPTPHTFHGENFAKGVIPIQNARTVLIRQIINHTIITNNPRLQVMNGTVQNPSELIDNRFGGIVNVRRMDGIAPIQQNPLNPFVFNLISMIDEDKEEVTGVSKLSQGMNKDAISTQNAQGMVEQLISQSQQRQKIIARRFGAFIRDLFLKIYQTAVDFVEQAEYVEVTGGFVEVNPQSWHNRTPASVELTLGYGERQAEYMKYMEIDNYLRSDPVLSAGYGYDRRYEVLTRAFENHGIEDIQTLLVPPDEYQQPPPNPLEAAEAALKQAQAQLMMAQAEATMMKAQAEVLKAQTDGQYKAADIQLDARRLSVEEFVAVEEMKLAQTADTQSATYNPDV